MVAVVVGVAIITDQPETGSRATPTSSTSAAATFAIPTPPPSTNVPGPGLFLAPSTPQGFTLADASNANPVRYIPPENRQLWADDPTSPATSRWFRLDATDDPAVSFWSGTGQARISTTHGVAVIGATAGLWTVTGPISGGHGSIIGRGFNPEELAAILDHTTLHNGNLQLDGNLPTAFQMVASETPEQAKTNAARPAFDTEAAVLTYQSTTVPGQTVTVTSGAYRSAFDFEADHYLPVVRHVSLTPTRAATLRTPTESPYTTAALDAVIDGIPVSLSGNAPAETLISFARMLRPISPTELRQLTPAKTPTFEATDNPTTGPIAHGVFADGITWRVFLASAGAGSPLRLTLITVPSRPEDADEADTAPGKPDSIQTLATVHGTIVIATLPANKPAATLHVDTNNDQLDTPIDHPTPDGNTVIGIVATQAFGIPNADIRAPNGEIINETS